MIDHFATPWPFLILLVLGVDVLLVTEWLEERQKAQVEKRRGFEVLPPAGEGEKP